MEINVEDYFTQDQIAEIVESELRTSVREKARADSEVLIVNGIYNAVKAHVDDLVSESEELQGLIRDNTVRVIEKLSAYSVFNKPDAWSRRRGEGDSVAQVLLEKAVAERADKIQGKVDSLIEEMQYASVRDLVLESVRNSFYAHEEDRDNE